MNFFIHVVCALIGFVIYFFVIKSWIMIVLYFGIFDRFHETYPKN